ncbi:hypothetical protein, partial [Shigella sonnei]|uniref:hypothetical protein n=1 Tax=Shigella sonnei TaxID=624 RepID=UPI00069B0A19
GATPFRKPRFTSLLRVPAHCLPGATHPYEFQAPAIRIYLFCQSSGWQVMRTQEQKEENTGERQTQI